MKIILYLVLALFQPQRTRSFATYLLSRSNCWTDLSTEEIIMNSRVVGHDESDDPHMHVHMMREHPLPAGTTYPTKVALQVITDNPATNRDYQFVMEVNGTGASFIGGSCENDRRIAGRAKEIVELTLTSAVPVTVWAGWAAGHEQVRLTPELIIQPADHSNEGDAVHEWHDELLNSCTSIDWATLETFAGRTIEHSDSAEIYMDGTVEIPQVALRNADFETWVIHCTAGATVGTTCPHMTVVSASDEWPVLHIEEERNIYISGLYSLAGNPSTLYRTKALELEWTPPGENKAEEDEVIDTEGVLVDEKKKEEPRGDDKNTARIRDKDIPLIQNHADMLGRVHKSAKQIERDREAVKKRGESWKASTKVKPEATPDKPFDHVMAEEDTTVDPVFDAGKHYYLGMAIMIGAGILTTQFCLFSSRRNKGRRDL